MIVKILIHIVIIIVMYWYYLYSEPVARGQAGGQARRQAGRAAPQARRRRHQGQLAQATPTLDCLHGFRRISVDTRVAFRDITAQKLDPNPQRENFQGANVWASRDFGSRIHSRGQGQPLGSHISRFTLRGTKRLSGSCQNQFLTSDNQRTTENTVPERAANELPKGLLVPPSPQKHRATSTLYICVYNIYIYIYIHIIVCVYIYIYIYVYIYIYT